MVVKLPRLSTNKTLVTKDGNPTTEFTRFWDEAMTRIENNINSILEAQEAAEAAQVAAESAQADAASAATDAAAAQVSADSAATAASDAQSTADAVVATVSALSALQSLQQSGVDENTNIVSHDAGSSVQVSVNAHTHYYGDGTSISVNSGGVGSLAYGTTYYIWYDDASRAGGAVTYHADTTNADAFPSEMHPDRHYVGSAVGINAADPDADGSPNYWAPQ